jgi:hypothetical protein
MFNFFLFSYQTFMTRIPGLTSNLVWRVSPVNSVLTRQICFFYLVIKFSRHEFNVWRVNLIWRVNPINSDFFSFYSLVFFLPFGFFFFVFFFLINLFNYHTFMTRPCSHTHIQDYYVWYCSQTHLHLGHASIMLLLIL